MCIERLVLALSEDNISILSHEQQHKTSFHTGTQKSTRKTIELTRYPLGQKLGNDKSSTFTAKQISDLRNAVKFVEAERKETVAFELEKKVHLQIGRKNSNKKQIHCKKA